MTRLATSASRMTTRLTPRATHPIARTVPRCGGRVAGTFGADFAEATFFNTINEVVYDRQVNTEPSRRLGGFVSDLLFKTIHELKGTKVRNPPPAPQSSSQVLMQAQLLGIPVEQTQQVLSGGCFSPRYLHQLHGMKIINSDQRAMLLREMEQAGRCEDCGELLVVNEEGTCINCEEIAA